MPTKYIMLTESFQHVIATSSTESILARRLYVCINWLSYPTESLFIPSQNSPTAHKERRANAIFSLDERSSSAVFVNVT